MSKYFTNEWAGILVMAMAPILALMTMIVLDVQTGKITGYAVFATGAIQVVSALVRNHNVPIVGNLLLIGSLLFVIGVCFGGVAVEADAPLMGSVLVGAGLVVGLLLMDLHARWSDSRHPQ
ncbi:MAG: hypothetical protein K0S68_830 [Candidatus Saccharibacteria bacterium]|nr:hypothetical protein [Candidatus Saccharibacteria bacterium]